MNPTIERCIEMVVATACVIAVLLIMADDPTDGDELPKGVVAGVAGFLSTFAVKRWWK